MIITGKSFQIIHYPGTYCPRPYKNARTSEKAPYCKAKYEYCTKFIGGMIEEEVEDTKGEIRIRI
jgi:hypothetical protein